MRILLLLLLILIPATVLAQQATYDLSCENVEKISITRISGAKHTSDSYPSTFHTVYFELKHSAVEEFSKLVKASRSIIVRRDGRGYDRTKLTITANGKPLRNDVRECDSHGEGTVGIMIIREQDALDAARAVCPALVPTGMTTYGPGNGK